MITRALEGRFPFWWCFVPRAGLDMIGDSEVAGRDGCIRCASLENLIMIPMLSS